MFKYGISFNTIFVTMLMLFILSSGVFICTSVYYAYCCQKNKKRSGMVTVIGLWVLVILGVGIIFFTTQRMDYKEKCVKEILNENYTGYTDFKNKDKINDSENSFIYKNVKYEWEYDSSDKKLVVICYGTPHEDAVFIDGEKY